MYNWITLIFSVDEQERAGEATIEEEKTEQ